MAQHNSTGAHGELLAQQFIKQHGYTLLETNYRYKRAEIDLIASHNHLLLFIEVKTRSSIGFSHPENAVTPAKQQLYYQAAMHYMQLHSHFVHPRFDIISIHTSPYSKHIWYFPDAFYPMQHNLPQV